MYQQQIHFVSYFPLYSLLDKLIEGDGVECETNDKESAVGDDGDDLGLTKSHVWRKGKIVCCVDEAWVNGMF